MAQSCLSTTASSLIFTSHVFTPSPSLGSAPNANTLSFPFHPLRYSKVRKLGSDRKAFQTSSVKAVCSGEFWAPERRLRKGIWSMRDDLQIPSSPFFPSYANGAQGQGPPPMVHERFQSVISQLFNIELYAVVELLMMTWQTLLLLNFSISMLLILTNRSLSLSFCASFVCASFFLGMAIFDTMRLIQPDVSTVCVGLAASMGAFLLSAGTKGKRYSLPNSRIMIHQPLGGAQGGQSDIDIQANEMLHHKANLNGYLAYHTGQSLAKINQDTDRDYFMSAKEAKDYRLIDGVILNPLKALQPLTAVV